MIDPLLNMRITIERLGILPTELRNYRRAMRSFLRRKVFPLTI